MAQSIPDIKIPREWVSLNALAVALGGAAFAVGQPVKVQKKGRFPVMLWEGTEPPSLDVGGEALTVNEPTLYFVAGSDEIWVRGTGIYGGLIHVTEGAA